MSLSCSSPVSPSLIPLWESNPDEFWGKQVERVRTAHNASGDQFVIADFGNISKLFPLGDVREFVERFWILEPEGITA